MYYCEMCGEGKCEDTGEETFKDGKLCKILECNECGHREYEIITFHS